MEENYHLSSFYQPNGEERGKEEGKRENYGTAIAQICRKFKDGIGRLELRKDAFNLYQL